MKKIRNFVLIALLVLPILVNAQSAKDGDTVYVLEEMKIACIGDEHYPTHTDYDGNLVFYDNTEEKYIKVNEKDECTELPEEEAKELNNMGYGSLPYYIDSDDTGKYFVYISQANFDEIVYMQTDHTDINGQYYTLNEAGDGFVSVENPVKEDLSKYYQFEYIKSAKGEQFDESLVYYVRADAKTEYFIRVENPKAEEIDQYYYRPNKPYKEVPFDVLSQEAIKTLQGEYEQVTEAIRLNETEFLIKAQRYAVDGKTLFDLYKTNGEKIEFLSGVINTNKLDNGLIMVTKDNSFEFYNGSLEKLLTLESNNVDETNPSNRNFFSDYGYNNYVQFLVKDDIDTGKFAYYTIRDYKIIEGENQTYKEGNLTFRFSGLLEKLTKVLVNDVEISKDYYTLASGSTIVTLKKEYLDTLETGTYKLKVEYNDGGSSEAEFKVEAKVTPTVNIPGTPDTYDGITTSIVLAVISLIGLALATIYIRKHNKN